jgi:hypothetical protein
MAKNIPLSGQDDRDDNKFEKAQDDGKQINHYVGYKDTGKHCHSYKEHDSGNSGVVHRGECNVCDDSQKSSAVESPFRTSNNSSDDDSSGGK